MASEIPLVRFFVVCEEVIADSGQRKYTLRDLIHSIVRLPGEPFPCIRSQMALFALLTNGRGKHEIGIEWTIFEDGEEHLLRRPAPRPVDFGQDPTLIYGLPIPLKNVVFGRAGQYAFNLLSDGRRIAEAYVDVR
jgi:hypothetical protein